MSLRSWAESPRTRLDVTAGMVDGVLTALTLATGRLLNVDPAQTASLALRVGGATALTTLFVFFVAHYAEIRADLARYEKQLNLRARGSLATGYLGRRAIEAAAAGALLAAVCGLAGAMIPLFLTTLVPTSGWAGVALTILFLGALGALLARSFRGSVKVWMLTVMGAGLVLAIVGKWLSIAG